MITFGLWVALVSAALGIGIRVYSLVVKKQDWIGRVADLILLPIQGIAAYAVWMSL